MNRPIHPRVMRKHSSAMWARKLPASSGCNAKAIKESGLGMSGLIGWSVAVPTLLGALLGLWLDHRHPSSHSWTLILLVIGLVIGCANAWHWMDQQNKAMQDAPEDKDE